MPVYSELEHLRQLLCRLQDYLRARIIAARDSGAGRDMADVANVTAADTIYRIDKVSEAVIAEWFAAEWPAGQSVELVMEGMEEHGPLTFPAGTPAARTRWKCIIDPIDGTRGLMYDKRPAWALAGLAPQRGPANTLADIVVAAMTELPVSKQWRSDQLSAVRGGGVHAVAHDLRSGAHAPLALRPSRAWDCRHGFAAISRFFPDGMGLLGHIEEKLWAELYPEGSGRSPLVFTDQYISTGGQLYELIAGHDRFLADLRPLVFRKLGLPGSLTCHPYDLAAALVATEAGIILEDPLAHQPLQAPLDTTTPVAWAAYANAALAEHIRPALTRLIQEAGLG